MSRVLTAAAAAVVLLCAIVASPGRASAQDNAPDAYAITGARIVTGTGSVIPNGTVVVRNGLIAAVGTTIVPPADARIIDAAGLTVYPGLVDALSSVGMPGRGGGLDGGRGGRGGLGRGGAGADAQDPAASLNSNQRPGLRPELMVADVLQVSDSIFVPLRNAGFTSALTAGTAGIFLGQSALINLDAATPTDAILRSPVFLHMGFGSPGGGYPASLMGVFASIRQILLDAQHYREVNALYEKNPLGIRRPAFDPSLAALQPVIDGTTAVVMYANSEREIRRALDLAEEFGLRVIIGGGTEAWKVVDDLRAANATVLLTANLPRRTTPLPAGAEPEPLDVLRSRVEAPKGAARLQQAGVRFAFHTMGLGDLSDFLPNIGRMVAQGLTADKALHAVTLAPAEIMGVSNRVGTVEIGKIANLTITSGDLFATGTRVRWVFIDGRPHEMPVVLAQGGGGGRAGRGGGTTTQSTVSAAGTWSLSITIGAAQNAATLVITQDGERLSGTITSELGRSEITDGRVNASGDIHFRVVQTTGTQTFEGIFDGRVSGDQMSGTVQIGGTGAAPFSGTRRPLLPGSQNAAQDDTLPGTSYRGAVP